jgi:Ca2+-binding RTX toxin-like protein
MDTARPRSACHHRNRRHGRKPTVESIEPRQMLSLATPAYDPAVQYLTITGTADNDTVVVWWNASIQKVIVEVGSSAPQKAPPPQMVVPGPVKLILFNGQEGNDKFTNKTNIVANAKGGGGDDVLCGGSNEDDMWGGPGNDLLQGNGGMDFLYGEAGDDRIEAGDGGDVAAGGDGRDVIFGDAGADWLVGNAGDDEIHGGSGSDLLQGDEGNDSLYGDDGADTLYGGAGNDWLAGGFDAAVDTYYGGLGADKFFVPIGDGIGAKVLKDKNSAEDAVIVWIKKPLWVTWPTV